MEQYLTLKVSGEREYKKEVTGGIFILVYIDPSWQDTEFVESILFGIEEEQVKAKVFFGEGDGLDLASKAAVESSARVGIGLGKDGTVALHHEKLPLEKPIQSYKFTTDPEKDVEQHDKICEKLKIIGTNSARLVKKVPLKTFN
ncbi:glycerol dehydratase reactivase beta/small subunit family protein [Natranaerofaba carboxydovora]|uniref:glycerol dehydratase reactivase beta/small subunit family protein n=1 Tax=Natranaerofaba carboxydovora TaxID=2742683 RepID=UPI001F1294AF|nr:glycerol dehydratase reactivase beta/small subunit family protein [Natranaerofaba carboxydovora]UMZ73461.1 Dehydratase medium subunit [Natranaerofaba carboxydovora]